MTTQIWLELSYWLTQFGGFGVNADDWHPKSRNCDPDFVLVFNGNNTSVMHRFKYNQVLPLAGNDVIVLSRPGALRAIINTDFERATLLHWYFVYVLNCLKVIRLHSSDWEFSIWGFLGVVFSGYDPKIVQTYKGDCFWKGREWMERVGKRREEEERKYDMIIIWYDKKIWLRAQCRFSSNLRRGKIYYKNKRKCYISHPCSEGPSDSFFIEFGTRVDLTYVMTSANCGCYRLKGRHYTVVHILPLSHDFNGWSFNRQVLTCCCDITLFKIYFR